MNKFVSDEKLELLGQPIPKEECPWRWIGMSDHHTFVFEIGLAPQFSIDLSTPIDYYQIKVTDKEVDTQIEHLRTRFGSLVPTEKVAKNSQISGVFFNEAQKIDKEYSFLYKHLCSIVQ